MENPRFHPRLEAAKLKGRCAKPHERGSFWRKRAFHCGLEADPAGCFLQKCISCTEVACLVVSPDELKATVHERRVDLSSDLALQVTSHVAFHPHPRSVQRLRPVDEFLGLLRELALHMGDLLALEASLQLLCSRRPCTCSVCIDDGVVLHSCVAQLPPYILSDAPYGLLYTAWQLPHVPIKAAGVPTASTVPISLEPALASERDKARTWTCVVSDRHESFLVCRTATILGHGRQAPAHGREVLGRLPSLAFQPLLCHVLPTVSIYGSVCQIGVQRQAALGGP